MELEDLEKQRREGLKAAQRSAAQTASDGEPTLRERFQRAMHYQSVDKLPNFEFGYWAETLDEWHAQGLPESVNDEASAYEYFGIENWYMAPVNVGLKPLKKLETTQEIEDWDAGSVPSWWIPLGDTQIISETEDTIIMRDIYGGVSEINKKGHRSIPHYLEYPIKDRKTWEPFKEILLDMADRYPDNWDDLVKSYQRRDYPLGISVGSMIGIPRNLIGFENIALMIYEDPALMEEIVETFCQCVEQTVPRALRDLSFDFGAGWEDICFNSGPIVGVPFFRDVIAPRYKRITDLLSLHGVDIVQTDCDGNLSHVVPYFLEGGINTMFPIEVHGGTDPVALRKQYGKQIRLWGGVDKMIFLQDKAAVEKELDRLRPVVEEGGFIPTVDHRVQADAKLDLYKFYLDKKRELFKAGGEPKY